MTGPGVSFELNGAPTRIDAAPGRRLSAVLRESCGCPDVKVGCDAGDCGACTVLLDGAPVCACLTPFLQVDGRTVTTTAGLSGEGLSRVQRSFLRHGAAQCGICTPGMLLAATALLEAERRPSRKQVSEALAGVLCRCTGYRKIVDAVCAAAQERPAAPSPVPGSATGARLERLDGVPKVQGTEAFGAEVGPADSLVVRALRSPEHSARFEFGDLEAWRRRHVGIRAVLTAADIPGRNRFGVIPELADQPALAEAHVRFRGEAVALVVGERHAVERLDLASFPVSWTASGSSMGIHEAGAPGTIPLHSDRPGNILIRGRVVAGDAEAALAGSDHVIEASFRTAFVEHAAIEPEAGCAWMDGNVLVLQCCTQSPVMDRDAVCGVLGLPKDQVRVVPSATGGGFGGKLDLSVQPLIGLAALMTGQPCRMVYTRQEAMTSTPKRHASELSIRLGADRSGHVTGMVFHGDFNTGPYASWGPTVATRVPVHASGPYRTPAYRATTRAVHTNGPIGGAFRGFGVPQAVMLQETAYDRLAEACGIDRLAFRRQNALRDGDSSVCGQVLQAVGLEECLAALQPRWDEALAAAAGFNQKHGVVRRGVGVASCWYGCGNTSMANPSTIRLGVTTEGRLRLHQGAVDIGQGSNTVITQLCADGLGVAVADFELVGPDTALTPDCGKTSASRQTFITGKAALLAGRALRRQILRLTNLGRDAVISLEEGRIRVTDGRESRDLDPAGMTPDPHGYVLRAEETYDPPTQPLDANGQGQPYAVYGYGAHLAEVDVDCELGTVRVQRITAAHDLGRAVNPLLAEGQIEGGIAQGLGLALMEEYVAGRTDNLHDYLIPTIGDMPEIDCILIERPDPEGPLGVKGLGEHVLIPTAPAILNAIRHATGVELECAPVLPHRLHAALGKRSSAR